MEDGHKDETYLVSLPEFEGPLDLLLHLVKRHELDILDIPISFITEKYLEYLDLMRSFSLDIAGEYLLMAATLALIKSRQMLPRPEEEDLEDEEEGQDPREELIRRLLEYQKYKEVGEQLSNRPLLGRQVFGRGAPTEDPADPEKVHLMEVSTFSLIEALADVLSRAKIDSVHDVMVDRISITDRINEIVDHLKEKETVRFLECFDISKSWSQIKHEVVITFLSILEMARLQMIRLYQHSDDGAIYLTRTSELHAVEDEVEEYD